MQFKINVQANTLTFPVRFDFLFVFVAAAISH